MALCKRIDWNAEQEKAQGMTHRQLWGAITDARNTLPYADDLDRELGSDDGGFYRDQISVYLKELKDRTARMVTHCACGARKPGRTAQLQNALKRKAN